MQSFDLYTWEQALTISNKWVIKSSTEASEVQTGGPTFLLTPNKLINIEITGQFRRGDADIMGFTVGLDKGHLDTTSRYNGHLIDWKPLGLGVKGSQIAYEGVKLNKMTNMQRHIKYFWGHHQDSSFSTIASVGNQSLNQSNWNDIKIIYTLTEIICIINGDTLFNEKGCYEAGRFGFYDYSMVNSKFRNFKYKNIPPLNLDTEAICIGSSIGFNLSRTKDCFGNIIPLNNSPVSAIWDFGDGFQTNSLNPNHTYSSPGTKTITVEITNSNGCIDSINKTINVMPALISSYFTDDICLGDTAHFTNTSSPYHNIDWLINNYNFSNDDSPSYCFDSLGTYKVKMIIKDSLNACIDSTEKKIEIYDLELNLGSDTTICGNSFLIQTQSNADLLWLNDSSTLSGYQVTQDENVILKASLGNCVVQDSMYVDIEKELKGGFYVSNICEKDTLVFQDTSNNSSINARIWILDGYQLASDSAYVEIQNATIGIHNASMIISNSAGCIDTINNNFTIKEKPDINLTGYVQVCDDQYQANISPPNGSQILWSNGSASNTPIFNQSGIHSVVVNYNGCINQDSFQLNLKPKPKAVIDAHDICEGDNLQFLNNSTGTILFNKWDFDNGITSTTLNPNITYNNPGTYNIELIVKALNNCSDTAYKLIIVDKRPLLNLGNDTTLCGNQMILDCGIINASYLWSDSSTSKTITINNSGVYSVAVDSGNCSVTDDINVVLHNKPQAAIGINGICTNDSISIFSNSIYTSPLTQYSWSINNQPYIGDTIKPIINNEQSLNIELVITDQNSCMDSVSINTYIYAPDFASIWTSGDTSIYAGEEISIHAYGAYDYEWFPKENLETPYEDHTIASPNQKQLYVVMAKDINGCTIYNSLTIDIKPNSQIYIPDAFTPNYDGKNDFYYLSGENICSINYSIYNRWGNIVFKANNINDKWDGRYMGKMQVSEGYIVFGNINFCDGSKQAIKKRIHLLH